MKYLKYFEYEISKINNEDIINFAKIYNIEKGYSNKAVYYSNNFIRPFIPSYIPITENPIDNFGYLIVGDLSIHQFIRNAKHDGGSLSLYMRALTNKVNEKYGTHTKIINVEIDGNSKIDIRKKDNEWDKYFRPLNGEQLETLMKNSTIIDEGILTVDENGKIKTNKIGDSWSIQYKESNDYIFTKFHSGWNVIMKESDFINKFMKHLEHLLTTIKYNL